MKNLLIKADNLIALNYLLKNKNLKNKIDLIYIDPPFATNRNFTVTKERVSNVSNTKNGDIAYADKLIGDNFLTFIKQRLILLRELMSENGSIYLHIDYKIGHYIKIIMDEVFGINNFRNDITRIKCNPKNFPRKAYGNVKDLILFYSKAKNPIWNEPKQKYTEKDIQRLFPKINKHGRRYTTVPLHAPGATKNGKTNKPFKGIYPPPGKHWRTAVEILEQWDKKGLIEWSSAGNPREIIFADEQEGKRIQDIWEYKDPQYPTYPTEKNLDLLDMIVRTSSHENSIVLDCFCGGGTTLKAAHINNRRWIGIDQSELAINTTINNLELTKENTLNPKLDYKFIDFHNEISF